MAVGHNKLLALQKMAATDAPPSEWFWTGPESVYTSMDCISHGDRLGKQTLWCASTVPNLKDPVSNKSLESQIITTLVTRTFWVVCAHFSSTAESNKTGMFQSHFSHIRRAVKVL